MPIHPFTPHESLRPVILDVLAFLWPLFAGIAAFVVGHFLLRWPKSLRRFLIASAIGAVVVGGAFFGGLLPGRINAVLAGIASGTVVLSWAALLLLGVVWSVPERRISTAFLLALAVVTAGLLLIESSGRVWQRYFTGPSWSRFADANGRLMQSGGSTCSPAAGVMLLHQYGIVASEGEMAYLADTTPLGTDAYGLARALARKVEGRGWRVEVQQTDYDSCVRGGWPFVAHVSRPDVGPHALIVTRAAESYADCIDPLDGLSVRIPREAFQQMWSGVAVRVNSDPN
jgi:hypothetical protein